MEHVLEDVTGAEAASVRKHMKKPQAAFEQRRHYWQTWMVAAATGGRQQVHQFQRLWTTKLATCKHLPKECRRVRTVNLPDIDTHPGVPVLLINTASDTNADTACN